MALAFRIMMFTLMFNLAAGIIGVALAPYYPGGDLPLGYSYDANKNTLQDQFNGTVMAPGGESSVSSWWIRFLDFISIGFFQQIQNILNNSLLGFTNLLMSVGVLPADYIVYFNLVISAIYALGILELFTGRRVTQ